MKHKVKYIGWSFDEASSQTFVDIVLATSPRGAEQIIQRMRPCAVLDSIVRPCELTEYIEYLQAQQQPLGGGKG